jgi:hypothetical protein
LDGNEASQVAGSIVDDAEARDAVRQLLKRFEVIAAQAGAIAYVLAKRDSQEFARLLEAADVAMKTVIQPLCDADGVASAVYAALDDPPRGLEQGCRSDA